MTHPHSDQRSVPVSPHPVVLSPYCPLVNAPVSPLDSHTSGLIPQHHSKLPTVVEGEVITRSLTTQASVGDDTAPTTGHVSKPSLLRRAIEDPYWILMTLTVALGLSITATVVYGIIQITLAIARWLATNGATLATITMVVILLMLGGGRHRREMRGFSLRRL